ncbi:two-partner secretion domain-containing protein [Psychrobacter lutiphocae]|uniref:two-partner secretion domain-containing protein n=1 Tax=Psychrobacter lutiphocae TaxID=540500 RepID=UPI000364A9A2|nr:hemagglutinin repeat-containing protein [Psychrobacter lutiphocae]
MNTKQTFKLSPQGRIASAVSMALVLPFMSVAALADNIRPIGDTTVSQVGKVDVVNIANPNAKGLSHNQYKKFNVSESGAVLNNSLVAGESQLAGQLEANSNLSGSASVILNEVVTKNPSLILGQQEVFGMAADYILANPNGITGENIGFINTKRASLVVGKPTIKDERLASFIVGDRNNNVLALTGEVKGDQRLDLLAPKVDINGNITATDAINVITGRQNIDYDTLNVSELERRQPHVTLDGQILGSMQSGRIRLHNTDAGATQTLQGQFSADQDFDAAANTLKVSDSDISGKSVSLVGAKQLSIGGEVQTARTELPESKEQLDDNVTLTHSGYKETQAFKGSKVTGDTIALGGSNIDIEGSQLQGNSINAAGDNISVSGVTTTNTDSTTARNSKGLWFNENEALDKDQQYHQSQLNANDDITLNASADLKIAGADIKGNSVSLSSGNDLVATSETTEKSHSDINRYKNETADLKSGARTITQATQSGNQSTISGANVSLNSGGEQRLEGVQLTADTANLTSDGALTVASSDTSNRQTDEEDFKYWSGIGGGETHINNKTQTSLTGSQINAKNTTLSSDSDVTVSASGIKADNALNVTAAGDVNISNGFATEQDYAEDRHGTAFNITDKKTAVDRLAQSTVASNVSAKELSLAGDNITLTGSDVAATGDLDTSATSALTTNAANATDITKTETYDISTDGKASSNLDLKDDFDNVINGGVDGVLNGSVTKLVTDGIDQLKNLEVEASGSIKGVTTLTTKGSGNARNNTISANNATLKAQEVSLNGTDINATNSVVIDGKQVSTGATEALTAVDSKVYKSTGPEAYVRGGATGVQVGVSIGHNQIIDEHNEYQAANSTIKAGNKATLNAEEGLSNQGTQITAATVDLAGQDINNDASYDRVVDRKVVAGGDAALDLFAGTSKPLGGGIKLSGDGDGVTTEVKTAHTTGITATNDANIAAQNTAVDAGTQISANAININADDYTGTAAYDSTVTTSHRGRGDININASTSDFTDVTVDAGGKGTYQYLQTGDAKAIKGSLKADTVSIDAVTQAVAAQDVEAQQYHINAGEKAVIAQDSDKQWNTAGGAELGGSVGVTVIPAAVTTGLGVLPSASAKAGFNYLGTEDTQAKVATIKTKDVSVAGQQLAQVDGANLESDNIVVKGNRANIAAAQDTHRAVGVIMNGNGGFAPDLASDKLGLGAKLGVVNETSNKAQGATVNTKNLTVAANEAGDALSVQGANITADNISLTNTHAEGDVNLAAAESKDYVGNFGLGANLGGELAEDSFDSHTAGAHLNVETDNSAYYAIGTVNADRVDINTGNDINLQANINAGVVNVEAGNEFSINAAQDDVVKVNVNTEASIDGNPVKLVEDIIAGNISVTDAITTDFNNGTILGLKASGKAGFDVDNQKITHQTSINVDSLNTKVGSGNIAVNAANVSARDANLGGAQVSRSNNDDFVHKVGASIDGETFSIPDFVDTIPSLITDALAGKPIALDIPVNVDVDYEWDDTDGANTKANVKL